MGPNEAIVLLIGIMILSGGIVAAGAALRYRYLWRRTVDELERMRRSESNTKDPEHLKVAVDSIAIEVERISEGQRYLTKVLGTKSQS
jgi:hypothetical protein